MKTWTPSKKCRAADHLLQRVRNLAAHVGLVVEPPFAVLHLPAQVGAGVEPEPGRVLGLVAGAVQVVEPIRQPAQRVGVDAMAWPG